MDRNRRPRIGARARARLTLTLAILAALGFSTPGRAIVPYQGWTPASIGLVSECGRDSGPAGYASPGCLRTQRIKFSPKVPGLALVGTARTGPWMSTDGMAWSPLAPHCVSLKSTAYTMQNATGGILPCGIADVAFDPLDAGTFYVSAFELSSILLRGTSIEPGGVFKSTNFGATWTRIDRGVPGLAGSALAVIHQPGKQATVVVGHLQHADHDVGRAWSVAVSQDDGATWQLPGHPCGKGNKKRCDGFAPAKDCNPSIVEASASLVAGLAVHPLDPRIILAGTNGGVYRSGDGGRSWSLVLSKCVRSGKINVGAIWAVAVSPNGTTMYAGDALGRIWTASSSAPRSWRLLVTTHAWAVSQLMFDSRDPSGRTMFMTAQNNEPPYRGREKAYIVSLGRQVTLTPFVDSWASGPNHEAGVVVAFSPYPLVNSAPAYWLAQSTLDPDVIYLSTTTAGLFWRSMGRPLPSVGSTASPSPPTIVVPSGVPKIPGVPTAVTPPPIATRPPTAMPSPTIPPR